MLHRLVRDLDTDDGSRGLRQKRRAISFARSHVQNIEAAAQIARQKIAMQMLDLNLPVDTCRQAFPGERQRLLRRGTLEDFTQSIILQKIQSITALDQHTGLTRAR